MKKIFTVLLSVLIVLSLLVPVFSASEETNVATQEIAVTIPTGYSPSSFLMGTGAYLQYSDDSFGGEIYIFCEPNLDGTDASALKSDEGLELLKKYFFSPVLASEDYQYTVVNAQTVDVNGVTAYELELIYSDGESDFFTYSCLGYIMATEENVYTIVFDDVDTEFNNDLVAEKTMSTCAIYGTYLGDDNCTIENTQTDAPSFSEYYAEFSEDEFVSDYDDSFFTGAAIIGFVILGIGGMLILGLIIAVVILAVKNSQKSKLIKEYEMRLNSMYSYNTGAYNPQQAYTPVMPTPVPQPVETPVPQPTETPKQQSGEYTEYSAIIKTPCILMIHGVFMYSFMYTIS